MDLKAFLVVLVILTAINLMVCVYNIEEYSKFYKYFQYKHDGSGEYLRDTVIKINILNEKENEVYRSHNTLVDASRKVQNNQTWNILNDTVKKTSTGKSNEIHNSTTSLKSRTIENIRVVINPNVINVSKNPKESNKTEDIKKNNNTVPIDTVKKISTIKPYKIYNSTVKDNISKNNIFNEKKDKISSSQNYLVNKSTNVQNNQPRNILYDTVKKISSVKPKEMYNLTTSSKGTVKENIRVVAKPNVINVSKNLKESNKTEDNKKNNKSQSDKKNSSVTQDVFACYRYNTSNELPDILQHPPTTNKLILFHETSCKSREAGKLVFHQRQACSIESAAYHNPNHDVYVLIATPTKIGNSTDFSDRIIKSLQKYKNIKFFYVNIDTYFENTPVQELYHSGKIQKSKYHLTHLGDVMKFVNLWRFGGIYMDLDMIILKNLDDLPPNFTALQSRNDMASGIMGFSKDDKGHKWAEMCLKDLNKTYRGYSWGYNANDILYRFLSQICNSKNILTFTKETCSGYETYQPSVFYPIPYPKWKKYFYSQYLNFTMRAMENSTGLHFWNHLTIKTNVSVGKNTSALELIARKHCPEVYSQLDDIF